MFIFTAIVREHGYKTNPRYASASLLGNCTHFAKTEVTQQLCSAKLTGVNRLHLLLLDKSFFEAETLRKLTDQDRAHSQIHVVGSGFQLNKAMPNALLLTIGVLKLPNN